MHISDCCQCSDIHISQGSVATYLRCGGIFKYDFVANLPMSLPVKKFENRLTFGEVMGKSLVSCFSETQCRVRQRSDFAGCAFLHCQIFSSQHFGGGVESVNAP